MPNETEDDAANRREIVATTGQPGYKSPRPVGVKAAKATLQKTLTLSEMMQEQLLESRVVNERNCVAMEKQAEVQKMQMEKQAEMQEGLSSAINLLSRGFQRSTYTVGSAAAIAADSLEVAEMEMKRSEMELKAEKNRRELMELRGETEVATEVATDVATEEAEVSEAEMDVQAEVEVVTPTATTTATPRRILWSGSTTPRVVARTHQGRGKRQR